MKRGRKAYLAASATSQAAALLRYVLLARILGPEQLGYAAMLILTAQFFESISDTGADRFLIQDAEGDTPTMQGFVQLVMLARGVLIAIALAVFAVPLAGLYRSAALVPSLIALGLAPLIGGFTHLDIRRLQRHHDFWPESVTTMVGEVTGLAATAAAAWVLRDHSAVVYGLVARATAMVAVSHIVAQRPYSLVWAKEQSLRFSRFAFPLFLNGVFLFAGGQGDRLIVGNRVGPAALGHYSAILLLVYYPSSMLNRFIQAMHLPQLAGARNDPQAMDRAAQRLAGRTLLLAVATAAGFAVVGPIATPILYGKVFAQGAAIFALVGSVQAARFLRIWPTTLSVSLGRSDIVLANNVVRMIALPTAILLTLRFHNLAAIVSGFMVGEILALVVALVLVARAGPISLVPELRRVGDFLLVCAALVACAWGVETRQLVWELAGAAASLAALAWVGWNERLVVGEGWRMFRREADRYLQRLTRRAAPKTSPEA